MSDHEAERERVLLDQVERIGKGGRRYLQHVYPLQPAVPGNVVQPGKVTDGAGRGLDFKPMLLTVVAAPRQGVDFASNNFGTVAAVAATAFPQSGALVAGDFVVQVMGQLQEGGFYLRRFSLAPFRQVQFDCSRWADVRVDVLACNAVGCPIYAIVSNQPAETTIDENLVYAETYAAAGTFLVPPGATSVNPSANDAGFAWVTQSFGGTVTIADAAVTAAAKTVKGTHFTTTGAWSATWLVST